MERVIVISPTELKELIETAVRKAVAENSVANIPVAGDLMNADEASSYLNIAKQTLYSKTSNRQIPFIKRGKKLMFRRSDLEKWLSDGKKSVLD